MTEGEMLKLSVEEFSRVQRYMSLSDKDSEAYKAMKERYVELKVILSASGVNLTELDRIKEWYEKETAVQPLPKQDGYC